MTEGPARKVTEVAVGVLIRADGAVLLADRPAGKPYAGYWEFPGGKIEPGESVADALARELREELGIAIAASLPWVTFEFDYPHAYVRLHFERVYDWRGTPHAREGQRLVFCHPGAGTPTPLLPAAVPALRWLQLPPVLGFAGEMSELGALLTTAHLRRAKTRPAGEWAGAYAADAEDIKTAARLQCDFALVGPILSQPGSDQSALRWPGFARLAQVTPLPLFAYGGLDASDLGLARQHGAHGVARLTHA